MIRYSLYISNQDDDDDDSEENCNDDSDDDSDDKIVYAGDLPQQSVSVRDSSNYDNKQSCRVNILKKKYQGTNYFVWFLPRCQAENNVNLIKLLRIYILKA